MHQAQGGGHGNFEQAPLHSLRLQSQHFMQSTLDDPPSLAVYILEMGIEIIPAIDASPVRES